MKRISFLKKMQLFLYFKRILKENKVQLEQNLNIRIDDAYRLYTVLNVPEELIGEAFSIKKSDIDKISESYIREYTMSVAKFLNTIGLSELFQSYEVKKVDKLSYLVVIGFSLFKTNKFYDKIYYRVIPIITLFMIIIISYFLLK
jgi:hypothetical protein